MMKLVNDDIQTILKEYQDALARVRLDEFEKEQLVSNCRELLWAYHDHFGEDTELRYRIRKRLVRLEIVLSVKGQKWNPFDDGKESESLNMQRKVHSLSFDQSSTMSYYYIRGFNDIVLRSSVFRPPRNILIEAASILQKIDMEKLKMEAAQEQA